MISILFFTLSIVLAQEGSTPPVHIHYCSDKIAGNTYHEDLLKEWIDTIQAPEDDIAQALNYAFANNYFSENTESELGDSLPHHLKSEWTEASQLKECGAMIRSARIPHDEWSSYCAEHYIPRTMDAWRVVSSQKAIRSLLYFFKTFGDYKFGQDFEKKLEKLTQKKINIKEVSDKVWKTYELKMKQKYSHFVSETSLIQPNWKPKDTVVIDPTSLSGSTWDLVTLLPSYPFYLGQKPILNPHGVRNKDGSRKQLVFGQWSQSENKKLEFKESRFRNWDKTDKPGVGPFKNLSPLSNIMNLSLNNESELNLLFTGYLDGVLIPHGKGWDLNGLSDEEKKDPFYPRDGVVSMSCYLTKDSDQLICVGRTYLQTLSLYPARFSFEGKDKTTLLMIFKRAKNQ